jgi:hypothetical protein
MHIGCRVRRFICHFFLLMICVCLSAQAQAETYGPPAGMDDPFVILSVPVDVTADNAVKARDQAIVEAQRKALMIFAERNLTPDDFASFTPPADTKISRLVSDFEINRESISAKRYAADFKVRFSKSVTAVVPLRAPQQTAPDMPEKVERDIPWEQTPSEAKSVLVLPYLERGDGRTLLWEDDNDWLKTWQQNAPSAPVRGATWNVPLGDIADIASGQSDLVWSGDYTAVEKLKTAYGVDEVVLAVASDVGAGGSVDLYVYRDGQLNRRQAAQAATVQGPQSEIWLSSMQAVLSGTAQSMPPVITMPKLNVRFDAPEDPAPKPSGQLEILASFTFATEAEWIALQRRLRQVSPPVASRIKSMTARSVVFAMDFMGSEDELRTALLRQNILLGVPDIDLDAFGRNGARKTVYKMRMINAQEGQ